MGWALSRQTFRSLSGGYRAVWADLRLIRWRCRCFLVFSYDVDKTVTCRSLARILGSGICHPVQKYGIAAEVTDVASLDVVHALVEVLTTPTPRLQRAN